MQNKKTHPHKKTTTTNLPPHTQKNTSTACRVRRVLSATLLQCTDCETTLRVSPDMVSCQCAPGYYRTSVSAPCQQCGTGYWCPGEASQTTRTACAAARSAGA